MLEAVVCLYHELEDETTQPALPYGNVFFVPVFYTRPSAFFLLAFDSIDIKTKHEAERSIPV